VSDISRAIVRLQLAAPTMDVNARDLDRHIERSLHHTPDCRQEKSGRSALTTSRYATQRQ
jgi:hypothetical protein